MTRSSFLAKLGLGLGVAVFFVAGLSVLLESRSSRELNRARALASAGDYAGADRHYFQALNWYAPWGSSQTAAEELLSLANSHLQAGRRQEALQSLLRLRSALIAARSFYQPRADLLEAATPLIALSLATIKLGESADPKETLAQAAVYQALYSTYPFRDGYGSLLVVLGFLLWAGAAFRLVFAYFRVPDPRMPGPWSQRLRSLWIPLAVFVYGYLMWLFSMNFA